VATLLLVILLLAIDGYSINGYWAILLSIILLLAIGGYSINGYW
jgi:hypothetical protein